MTRYPHSDFIEGVTPTFDELLAPAAAPTANAFEVRHDPATGRFLPKGDAGGQKAAAGDAGRGRSRAVFPANSAIDPLSSRDRQGALDAMGRFNRLFPGAGVTVQFAKGGYLESIYQGAAAWTMAGERAQEQLGVDAETTIILGVQENGDPAITSDETVWAQSGLAHVEDMRAYTLDHELGHAATFAAFQQMTGQPTLALVDPDTDWPEGFIRGAYARAGLAYDTQGPTDANWRPPINGFTSSYGAQDPLEFIAEAVALEQANLRSPGEHIGSEYTAAVVSELNRALKGPGDAAS